MRNSGVIYEQEMQQIICEALISINATFTLAYITHIVIVLHNTH